MKKNPLITGTLLLTAAGFLSRILGFFYRIFLSRAIGAEGLGIYQMIFPIHGIAFALCAGPIQTSISRLAAANTNKAKNTFRTGLIISLCFSFIIAIVIRQFASFISEHILLEPLCAPLLPVMALSIPFSAVHACICGYYYGLKKTVVPALSQLVEQMIRIGAVLLIARVSATNGHSISVTLAVWGMLIGEIASAAFSFLIYSFTAPEETNTVFFSSAAPLMAMALPLMGNRLILNCLQSMEAIFVPNKLLAFGLTGSEALSTYGVLTGMALPFIFFPSAITNSLAVILLPTVSEAEASGDHQKIERTIAMALRYSMYMGILCIGIFTLFGNVLGVSVFHNPTAGRFISVLAWLCPFMYLSTTMGSILNGLGKTSVIFLHNAAAMLVTLLFVVFGIPRYGIYAYLAGLLVSELLLAALHTIALSGYVPVRLNAGEMILKPSLCLTVSVGILYAINPIFTEIRAATQTDFFTIVIMVGLLCLLYGGLLLVLHKRK
ncbi:MAG: polysaccharide biosynthesis protein [Clostridium sp.]